jgi:hypothetical protein
MPHGVLKAVDPPGTAFRRWKCARCGRVATYAALGELPCLPAEDTPTVVTDRKKIN